MEIKEFKRVNRVVALAVLLLSAITYLMTIEPTASFWDCGEFIASSYKLEVGHPPGNPVFQLFARLFTLFGDAQNAAMLVNAMSALCSAFTIFFLYLTIVHFARRIFEIKGSEGVAIKLSTAIAIYGAGVVGSLASLQLRVRFMQCPLSLQPLSFGQCWSGRRRRTSPMPTGG